VTATYIDAYIETEKVTATYIDAYIDEVAAIVRDQRGQEQKKEQKRNKKGAGHF
jgi:hypothetical protein